MVMWFSPNHVIEFFNVGTIFWVEFKDCFMAEFIAINESLESCKKIK